MKFRCKTCNRYTVWDRRYLCPGYCRHCGCKLEGRFPEVMRAADRVDKDISNWLDNYSGSFDAISSVIPKCFEVGICLGVLIIAYFVLHGLIF